MKSIARTLALLGLAVVLPAMAQEFPSRPIVLICPWPAGGSTDKEFWYQSSEDYAKYARATLQNERALIERLGLLAK